MTNETSKIEEADKKLPPLSDAEKAAAESDSSEDPQSTAEALQLSSGMSSKELEKRAIEAEADRTEIFRNMPEPGSSSR